MGNVPAAETAEREKKNTQLVKLLVEYDPGHGAHIRSFIVMKDAPGTPEFNLSVLQEQYAAPRRSISLVGLLNKYDEYAAQHDKETCICVVYPDGREVKWMHNQEPIETTSQRGIKLAECLGEPFKLGLVVQWRYKGGLVPVSDLEVPLLGEEHAFTLNARYPVDEKWDVQFAHPREEITFDDLHAFWDHFRTTNPVLLEKYGPGKPRPDSEERYERHQQLYIDGKFEQFFTRFVELDNPENADKLVRYSILSDSGFAFVNVRLAGKSKAAVGPEHRYTLGLLAIPTSLRYPLTTGDFRVLLLTVGVEATD